MATKWGVYSAGKICNDFVVSVLSMKSADHQFVAVAARDLKRAQEFAKLQQISKAYGTYEELAKDPDVEVVYIGTINTLHLSATKLMLEHGKHVLCEKPLTLNTKQNEELFALAKQKKLFVMEALWSRFLPSFEFAMQQISKRTIGDVMHVSASLGWKGDTIPRLTEKALGGGLILDLGVYCINVVEQAFDGETLEKVEAVGHTNAEGVDIDFTASLKFKNNGTASIASHCLATLPNEAIIVGTEGTIRLGASFNGATKVYVNEVLHEFQSPTPILPLIYQNTGLCYQANEVRRCLKAGLLESPRMSHNNSLTISKIQDQMRKQIGVKFDVD